jgi:uncharacterized DUF497 family protein
VRVEAWFAIAVAFSSVPVRPPRNGRNFQSNVLTNRCTKKCNHRMDLAVAGFEWDKGNREKCQKHGVPLAEIEGLFSRPLFVFRDPTHSRVEERFKAIGRTDGCRAQRAYRVHPAQASRGHAYPSVECPLHASEGG